MHDGDDRWQEFEVEGQRFRIKPLKVKDAEDLAQPLVELLTPAAAALLSEGKSFNDVQQALLGIGRATKQLPLFREKFAAVCEFESQAQSGKPWLPLSKFIDDVFERKHKRYYAWVRECITKEFGDFLAEIGQGAMEKLEAKLSSFLAGFDGASGASQPIPESKTPTSTSGTAGRSPNS
jgi:hypothetical protein